MVKINLVIDGNYIINKLAFILKNDRSFYVDFPAAIRKDFDRAIALYNFDNIYFVSDSKSSWRKRFLTEYKGTRKKDTEIDWEYIFKMYDEFKEEIKSKTNVSMYQIDELEGDDLVAYIVKESNKLGFSNLIISNDRDIHQLLDFSTSENWINFIYNFKLTEEKLYISDNYEVFMSNIKKDNDIFNLDNDDEFKEFLYTLLKKCNVNEINSEESLFCKLITGDKGDNISSCYFTTSADGKKRGIGDAGSEKIYKIYKDIHKEFIDFESEEFIHNLSEVINYDKKINDDIKLNEVKSNLKQNRLLIRLNSEYIPKSIHTKLLNDVKIKV